ncbi:MAG: hypothetical protein COT24_02985 [Candidatus Kerfeldbacteria bacterium CG08_land_8_20_14_0_20_40_16]|uniref:WxL domain-containing protein n=2 Tax=Bacteria candidate phyla TaxID=1783234 RepID=A0A2G9XCU4_UNCKA|nr:MAG: hypothetical protein COX53_00560 [candidate division WWE3 bacterium CG23_combo_of_CG06-09_8_20_14_all_40_14]PIS42541.1 MAG: hypothetical protein COT24_02985 [Candidatus Kerfeldbacteria bacterium CG08_land_8_20_14_0_20_40_16]
MSLENRIKEIKQKIVAVLVISVMFALVFTTLNLNPNFAGAATTNVTINIAAGTLSIESTGTVSLGSTGAGSSTNVSLNNLMVNVKDFAGDGLNWAATVYSSNFTNGAGGSKIIPNTRFQVRPNEGTIYNAGTSSCSTTASGTPCGLSSSCALFNGNPSATGECRLNAVNLNLQVLTTDPTADYNATLTLSVSAT